MRESHAELEIHSVKRGICPIAKSTMTELYGCIAYLFFIAHA